MGWINLRLTFPMNYLLMKMELWIFIGSKAPIGKESNWVKTLEGQSWFTYFRLYGPKQGYFDKSWKLNDIEMVK